VTAAGFLTVRVQGASARESAVPADSMLPESTPHESIGPVSRWTRIPWRQGQRINRLFSRDAKPAPTALHVSLESHGQKRRSPA